MKSTPARFVDGPLKFNFFPLAGSLGVVNKCTLPGSGIKGNIDGRSYCFVDMGYHTHPVAFNICKKLNARLPLPRNKQEAVFFTINVAPWTHVDARNPKKTSNKTEWVDAENKPLGTRPVYLRGHNHLSYFHIQYSL